MKKWIGLPTAVIMVAGILLSGCAAPASSQAEAAGFNKPDKVMTGGKPSETQNINVKEITSAKEGENTVIDIKLIYGSRNSDRDEARLNDIPEYEISCLGSPERLAVKLKDIAYYDYDETKAAGGIVQYVFKKTAAQDGDFFELYFNLAQSAAYRVDAEEDGLKITLHPLTTEEQTGFFVTLDDFDDEKLPADIGMTPTMCADGQNVVLISTMFKTRDEAESFKTAIQQKLQDIRAIPMDVVQLAAGELPPYSDKIDTMELTQIPIIKQNGKEHALDLMISDGAYLCTAPDGTVLFSRSYQPEPSVDTSDAPDAEDAPDNPIFKNLWTMDKQGEVRQLDGLSDLTEVLKAAYSPSGRYLGVQVVESNNITMYVYDTKDKKLLNMGEEGLGDTDDFAWDSAKDALYSVSGTEDSKQLMVCDFTGDYTPQALEEQGIESGQIAFANGQIYFADQIQEEIFQFDKATGTRKKLADGPGFLVSPDGKYLAYYKHVSGGGTAPEVQESAEASGPADSGTPADESAAPPDTGAEMEPSAETDDGEEDPSDLLDFVLMDLATGTEKTIVQEADISYDACSFSPDSSKIYFINMNYENDNLANEETYTNPFFAYDIAKGQASLLFTTSSERFFTSSDPNKLYFISALTSGGKDLDVTYTYDFTKSYQ